MPALRCSVVEGAGYPEAVAANIDHGLPLSKEDRKDAARWWAETDSGMSYVEIGRRVGLSDKTVKAAITEADKPQQPKPKTDPVARFVSQILRTYDGDKPSTRAVRREIDSYDDAARADVADALADIGNVLVDAASPYLEGR